MSRALGRYELVRPLARGGMAEVFLARRRAGGVEKLLVVKRIRAERASDPRFLELFVREARLSMSLAHQNIVPVFDFGRSGEQLFLAMERVEGKDLGSSLARGAPPLPALVAAFIAAECCQALDYAHRREGGVVHRDVTPRNVLLSWSGEVKLTDFGIAALAGDDTTALAGTPAYMAPEQARGATVDARADVYAVGLVLREALTGARARPGDDRESTLAAARSGALAPWPGGETAWPAGLVAIADRATAAAPEARFPDARTMLAALDAYLVGARAATPGESPARQLATWLERVWGDARDEPVPSGSIEGAELASFLDDGAAGTGTERSLAATVASVAPAPPRANRSRRYLLVAFALGAVLIVGAAAARGFRRRAVAPPIDAAVLVDAAPPPPPPIDAAIPIDAAPPPIDAAPPRERDRPRPRSVPAAVRRKVRINSIPWSTFTVDGDATVHTTIDTVELTPGAHRLRFTHPTHGTRDVTIVVPPDRDTSHVEHLDRD